MGSTYAQWQPLRIIGMSEIKQILLYFQFYGCTRKTLNMTKNDTIIKNATKRPLVQILRWLGQSNLKIHIWIWKINKHNLQLKLLSSFCLNTKKMFALKNTCTNKRRQSFEKYWTSLLHKTQTKDINSQLKPLNIYWECESGVRGQHLLGWFKLVSLFSQLEQNGKESLLLYQLKSEELD